jgi:hypothetical protein
MLDATWKWLQGSLHIPLAPHVFAPHFFESLFVVLVHCAATIAKNYPKIQNCKILKKNQKSEIKGKWV